MQHQIHFRCIALLCFSLWLFIPAYAQPQSTGKGSFTFIENRGQIVDTDGNPRPDIAYVTSSEGVNVYFTSSGVSYVFVQSQETSTTNTTDTKKPLVLSNRDIERSISTYRVDMELVGAVKNARILPEEQTTEYFNYYYAHCPNGITGVLSYHRLVYSNVYNNIDLVFYENEHKLKYDFVVRPGGRVSDIRFRYNGAEQVHLTPEGKIVIATPLGNLKEYAPVSYQSTPGVLPVSALQQNSANKPITSRFIHTDAGIGFDVGKYESTQTLVIDPEVQWSTFLGGSGDDGASHTVAVDTDDHIVIRGETSSSNFPVTAGAIQTIKAQGYDAFVAKLTNTGQRVWVTYYGGNGNDSDRKLGGIAVDGFNNILIAGTTGSTNFPVSSGGFQTRYGGGNSDAYIVKLSASGVRIWGTLFGGDGFDRAYSVATDSDRNVVVCGETASQNLPVSDDAFQKVYGGAESDAFIVKLDENGQRLWGTYYGGGIRYFELGFDVAIDSRNNILVAGMTGSPTFPVTPESFQTTYAGNDFDAFLIKFDAIGNRQWATLYGGEYTDEAIGVAVDRNDNVFIVGNSRSVDFPVTDDAFQRNLANDGSVYDAAIVKFNADGQRQWATYYGGRASDVASKIRVGANGDIYITGLTTSPNFPITTDAFQSQNAGSVDCFILKMSNDGRPLWSTYYGGSREDEAKGITLDGNENIIISGHTSSSDFPVFGSAFQKQYGGGASDAFIVKFGACDIPPPVITVHGSMTFCIGDSVTLDAGAGYSSYLWSNGATTQSIVVTQSGVYSVTVQTSTSCSATSDPLTITVQSPSIPVITAQGSTVFCIGDSVILDAGTGFSSYLWSNGATTQSIVAKQSGVYTVTAQTSTSCSATSDPLTIIVQSPPMPVIKASGSTTFCESDSVTLDAGADYSAYLWSTGEITRTIIVRTAGSYWVSVRNTIGCTGTSATIAVVVENCDSVQCEILSGIINTYSVVSAVNQSTATLTVGDVGIPSSFKAGDQVLLIQMQGASIDTSNTESYGAVQSLNGAGNYEFAIVKEVRGRTVTLTAPLIHSDYDVTGHIQLVSVPQYDHATVVGVLTCAPWNGETGGILAFHANCLILDGNIDISGKGFRGAVYADQPGSVTQPHNGEYISDNAYYWAMKGEGIAGNGVEPFIYGKGSPANGGGGGNNHNAGGGGGANYGNGGIGGYGYQGVPGSFKIPQGVGGKGLAGIYNGKAGRLFTGGGGGSGHINHTHGSRGANGGGITFIRAHRLRSNGNRTVTARGENAPHDSSTINPDGCGGGGAGGSIVLDIDTIENILTLDVSGGNGGSRINSLTSSGPGGGGSGGMIALTGDTAQFTRLITVMDGGAAGTEPGKKNYGATNGQPGGRRTAFVVSGRMKTQELAECKGCMPVVRQKNLLCGKTIVIVSDAGEPVTSVTLDEARSSNAIVSIVSSLPSKYVVIEVGLQEELQAGHYTLIARNGSGREITINGVVHPLPAIPSISFDGQLLTSTPAQQYQWYYSGNAVYNGKARSYQPFFSGVYTVKTTDENGCTVESEPFTVLLTGVLEQGSEEVVIQPNPVHERLTVRIPGVGQRSVTMEVRNTLGMVVVAIPAQSVTGVCEQTIGVEHLPAGVYFLSINNGRESIVRKFVKN